MQRATARAPVLKRDRAVIMAGVAGIAALAWAYLLYLSRDMQAMESSGMTMAQMRPWDASSGDQLLKLTGHKDLVLNVAFSPDGQSLASGSFDGTVKFWYLIP